MKLNEINPFDIKIGMKIRSLADPTVYGRVYRIELIAAMKMDIHKVNVPMEVFNSNVLDIYITWSNGNISILSSWRLSENEIID